MKKYEEFLVAFSFFRTITVKRIYNDVESKCVNND